MTSHIPSPHVPHSASLILALLCSLVWYGCNSRQSEQSSAEAAEPVLKFGDAIGQSPRHDLADIMADPTRVAGQTVRVAGHVRRACSAKGCWMELVKDTRDQVRACRVTFKDYGFFVPTDSAGAEALVEGQVSVKRVRAEHVKHYEGEGATFPSKRDDGSADEVRIVATGVELTR